jgi:hypothetical protein
VGVYRSPPFSTQYSTEVPHDKVGGLGPAIDGDDVTGEPVGEVVEGAMVGDEVVGEPVGEVVGDEVLGE